VLEFPSSTHLSWSDSYSVRLSGLGDPTGSNVTIGVALRLTGSYKPLHHCKVYPLNSFPSVSSRSHTSFTLLLSNTTYGKLYLIPWFRFNLCYWPHSFLVLQQHKQLHRREK
jgi:hypothetical protein